MGNSTEGVLRASGSYEIFNNQTTDFKIFILIVFSIFLVAGESNTTMNMGPIVLKEAPETKSSKPPSGFSYITLLQRKGFVNKIKFTK